MDRAMHMEDPIIVELLYKIESQRESDKEEVKKRHYKKESAVRQNGNDTHAYFNGQNYE